MVGGPPPFNNISAPDGLLGFCCDYQGIDWFFMSRSAPIMHLTVSARFLISSGREGEKEEDIGNVT